MSKLKDVLVELQDVFKASKYNDEERENAMDQIREVLVYISDARPGLSFGDVFIKNIQQQGNAVIEIRWILHWDHKTQKFSISKRIDSETPNEGNKTTRKTYFISRKFRNAKELDSEVIVKAAEFLPTFLREFAKEIKKN